MKKAIIAMSGGVDSSVAALLAKDMGMECIGATMKLFSNEDAGVPRAHSCCSLEDVEDARSVAYAIGIPYYVFQFTSRFHEDVIEPFIHAYENGMTPNPCIDCNKHLKFDKMLQRAREIGYDYVITGHYSQIEYDENRGRYLLRKAVDSTKDQSYVLYAMTQDQLAHTLFPLGGMTKQAVREIAAEHDFINAKKHDSQDICFVQNGSYADFIEQYTGKKYPEGDFLDKQGNVLGRHKGIIRYTIGQRKGLGLALPQPMYVCEINVQENTVVLGLEEDLLSTEVTIHNINLISTDNLYEPIQCRARTRYNSVEQPAEAVQLDEDTIKITFREPQRAVTKGQAAVLYDGDLVIGGGTIA